jgi:Flp pilus assembly protein TadG
VVEFALILPILLVVFLAVADVARIYTSMMTIESAAREAADFGAWNSSYWEGDPADPTSNAAKTLAAMAERGCIAARTLPDYAGPDTACTNPAMTVELLKPNPTVDCSDNTLATPCRVKVTMSFDFHLIVPLGIDVFGQHVGFPSQLTFTRDSIFAISDFDVDTTP